MAANKKEHFSKADNELADFSKAMAHPARVAILKVLAKRNECICGEIVEILPLAQATVSQHLKELLKADLIKGTVSGPRSCYCINWKKFERIEKTFLKFFDKAKTDKSCC